MKYILEKPMNPHSAFYAYTDMIGHIRWTDNPNHAKRFSSRESAEAMRGELGRDVVVTELKS